MTEINKENKGFLEFNQNEYIAHPILWNTKEVVPEVKFIILSTYLKVLEWSHTRNLTAQLKTLE